MVYRPKASAVKAEESVAKAEQVEEIKVDELSQSDDKPQPQTTDKAKVKIEKPRSERNENLT